MTILHNAFPQLAGNMNAILEQVVEAGAQKVAARAKQNIVNVGAVDTGATLNSIDARPAGPLTRSVGPTTSYAIFIEHGTVHMPSRPFLIPALEAETPTFQAAVKAAIEQAAGR